MKKLKVLVVSILIVIPILSNSQELIPISKTMNKKIKKEGIEKAIDNYKMLYENNFNNYDFGIEQLSSLGWKYISKDKVDIGLALLELNSEIYPSKAKVYNELAKVYLKLKDKENLKFVLKKSIEIEELKDLELVILQKRLFFVQDDFIVPELLEKDRFLLLPLKEEHTEMDYEAIMKNKEHLKGTFASNWPEGVTLEEDRTALIKHENEFKERVAFVYTVLNPSKDEVIGCVYLYPSRLDNFDCEVVLWVTEKEYNQGLDDILLQEVKIWIEESWPFEKCIYPGREISWKEFFITLDEQDQKYIQN